MSPVLEKIQKNFIPKKDLQQDLFLQRYPKYDGRGILIAIIDGGIDVCLEGMQKTSTGLPKIVDCFDFSGTNVVDTSMVRKTSENNTLLLLSGKEIMVPKNWKNPSNEWHLGIKSCKEMYSKVLAKSDIHDEKKEENKCLEENETKIEKIKEAVENINLNGTVHNIDNTMDCIVRNDGIKWCTCIIPLSFSKNLENAKILTNFRDEHEYCFIFDNICCCVTIENDGHLLKLFISKNDHGSCVAQVAAAHYPDQPENNGLAPGAQIVSINLKKCIELGADIVNLSTGGISFTDR
uniref:Peptidase S8/S53 domain-containing protein n=1 Tax=Panagrolaimus davidi TaxID=227884 RepID=A0A914P6H9_9BILA